MLIKKIKKSIYYSRIRQYFPMPPETFTDDRMILDEAQEIHIDWPINIKKPNVGIVPDLGKFPSWTKYVEIL